MHRGGLNVSRPAHTIGSPGPFGTVVVDRTHRPTAGDWSPRLRREQRHCTQDGPPEWLRTGRWM